MKVDITVGKTRIDENTREQVNTFTPVSDRAKAEFQKRYGKGVDSVNILTPMVNTVGIVFHKQGFSIKFK